MLVGTLQTLNLRPLVADGSGYFRRRISCFPSVPLRSPGDFALAMAHSPHIGETRPVSRPIRATGGSGQVHDGGSYYFEDSTSPNVFSWMHALLDFAVTNFLPIGGGETDSYSSWVTFGGASAGFGIILGDRSLISGMTLGLANPTLGCLAHRYSLSRFSTFGIFIISGLMLRSREIGTAIEAWPAGMLGLGSILFVTPLFSKLILKIQLSPPEFVVGLAMFCCMPTTLSSGVALTNLAGGNSALALAMTVISNLLGIIFVPFSLSKFIGAGAGVSIPTMELFKSLITTLLVPLVLGKIRGSKARFMKPVTLSSFQFLVIFIYIIWDLLIAVLRDSFEGVAEYVDQNRKLFSMMNSALLGLVPWIQVSRSRPLFLTVKPTAFAIAISTGIFLHIILLAFNTLAVQILSTLVDDKESVFAKKENSRAIILVASQKTLPVMVAVVEQLRGALGEPGLLVLPCVAAHINQIIIDSFLVNLWLQKDRPTAKAK